MGEASDGEDDSTRSAESMGDAYDSGAGEPADGILPDARGERILTVVLLGALLVALAGVVYVSVTPTQTADPYTEFYVVGTEGNASGFPTNLTVGESGEFVVGVTNHEHVATDYAVVARLGDRQIGDRSVRVADGQTWEDAISFTARNPGEHRLRILLYKDGNATGEPDDFLRLWVSVSEPSS